MVQLTHAFDGSNLLFTQKKTETHVMSYLRSSVHAKPCLDEKKNCESIASSTFTHAFL